MAKNDMQPFLDHAGILADRAHNVLEALQRLVQDKKTPAKAGEYFSQFDKNYNRLVEAFGDPKDLNYLIDLVDGVRSSIGNIARVFTLQYEEFEDSFESNVFKIAVDLSKISDQLKELVESQMSTLHPDDELVDELKARFDESAEGNKSLSSSDRVKSYINQLEAFEERQNKRQSVISSRLDDYEIKLNAIEKNSSERLAELADFYEKSKLNLQEKDRSLDKLLGAFSARVMAGGYTGAAAKELLAADILRYSSIGIMILAVIFIGWSLLGVVISGEELLHFLSRLALGVALSIPAAYLAKESEKHRNQYYRHLQKSLDLQAISPYIASLPDAEQHRLKAEIANRLFAADLRETDLQNSYPINVQEILLRIIDKFDKK